MPTDRPARRIVTVGFKGNFGDDLTERLLGELFGIECQHVPEVERGIESWVVVGSILSLANQHSNVLGAGFMLAEQCLYVDRKPKRIVSVRGNLSRAVLEGNGIACPKVYGDLGLFVRYLGCARQFVVPKYKLGLIPHYVEKDHPLVSLFGKMDGVKVIDIQAGIDQVIADIQDCETCLSSSLHGLIACDSLGVPNRWMQLSDGVVGAGFKFYDYFSSCGRKRETPFFLLKGKTVEQIAKAVRKRYRFEFDFPAYLDRMPFEPVIGHGND
ncbi:polysaccharide pyruvyl transferase family protein [Lysobacter capsici]|uniref:polysaccharide pyruvyl transferase family protein n=1 Tax=Lysobacter capsici TaxID=435897 RepID=UPI000716444D|nr:polysaccharide pyruvyl transferase family protein [Lysobacter capsici]ALN87306.1 polysaccharide pyruvyl transferase family protein [Lysobacter capsici]